MPPSDVARVMSASRNGLLMDDLVPRMDSLVPRPFVKYKRTRQHMRVCREKGLVNNYACSLGSHKMKGSAHTTYAVPATALQILLMLARYIPCTPSVLDNVV